MKKLGISPTPKGESPQLFTVAAELPAEQQTLPAAPELEEAATEPTPATPKSTDKQKTPKGRRRIGRKPDIFDARL